MAPSAPTSIPTVEPTLLPTDQPSMTTFSPSTVPTSSPFISPTATPSMAPTMFKEYTTHMPTLTPYMTNYNVTVEISADWNHSNASVTVDVDPSVVMVSSDGFEFGSDHDSYVELTDWYIHL